jgi:methionyl-tRNA synthetase
MQVRLALNLIPLYAVLSAPFIPDASARMLAALGAKGAGWPEEAEAAFDALPPGHAFTVPETLFAKIADEDREAWAARFAGLRG